MAFDILDNVITVIPLEFSNAAGDVVPPPAGLTGAVTVSNADNFLCALSDDGMSAHLWAVQPPTAGAVTDISYSITLADGTVLTATESDLVITSDMSATSVRFDMEHVTTMPLPVEPPPVV